MNWETLSSRCLLSKSVTTSSEKYVVAIICCLRRVRGDCDTMQYIVHNLLEHPGSDGIRS